MEKSVYYNARVTQPAPISENEYNDYLECLPPCRYHKAGRFGVFHISAHITGDVVRWCAWAGSMTWACFPWDDYSTISTKEIVANLEKGLRR